jgi:hypothetical protein
MTRHAGPTAAEDIDDKAFHGVARAMLRVYRSTNPPKEIPMHEPNLFQASIIVLMAALTASAPNQSAYVNAQTRHAGLDSADIWPHWESRGSLIAHAPTMDHPLASQGPVRVQEGAEGHHRPANGGHAASGAPLGMALSRDAQTLTHLTSLGRFERLGTHG